MFKPFFCFVKPASGSSPFPHSGFLFLPPLLLSRGRKCKDCKNCKKLSIFTAPSVGLPPLFHPGANPKTLWAEPRPSSVHHDGAIVLEHLSSVDDNVPSCLPRATNLPPHPHRNPISAINKAPFYSFDAIPRVKRVPPVSHTAAQFPWPSMTPS